MSSPPLIIAPSLLSADFRHLDREIESVEKAGADWHHFDVMDGHFVPNLSFSPLIQGHLRKLVNIPIDTHLMMTHPSTVIDAFIQNGSDNITIHVECEENIGETLNYIKSQGVSASISLKPNTAVETLKPYLPLVSLVLVMTVEPGFGGQSFMHNMLPKIEWLKEERSSLNLNYHIEVDGGINESTSRLCRDAGANVIVAGSYVYNAEEREQAIQSLRPVAC